MKCTASATARLPILGIISGIMMLTACEPSTHPTAIYKQGFRPIYNGSYDTSQQHMAVVAIYNTAEYTMCSGTLVAPKVVLTAGHCVYGMSDDDFMVFFGSDMQSTGTYRSVTESEVHPNYNPGGGYSGPTNDIALLRLNNEVSGVTPIPYLPQGYALTSQDVGDTLVFVGFGITESSQQNTRKMSFTGTLGYVCTGPSSCTWSGAWVAPKAIAYSNQSGGPCSGDSGGPAFYTHVGQEYVAGVTSYGDQNCTYFGVSTKVDAFQSFIEDFIGNTTPEDCINNVDDDGDSLTDCDDPECASEAHCSGSEACETPQAISCDSTVSGTTAGGSTRFVSYSCYSGSEVGPETAFQISAPVGTQVTLTLSPMGGQDLDLFILPAMGATCNPNGCLGASTRTGATQEALTLTLPPGGTYALVDSYSTQGASFQLNLDCSSITEICDNNMDDDSDGKTDCGDPDCVAAINCQGTQEICNNGIDDDLDNKTDCSDPQCASAQNCQTNIPEICNNGVDDDGDQFVDCADSECSPQTGCQSLKEICDDGEDNDQDGLIDCVDPDCRGDQACAGIPMENCANQLDDDGDQFVDCADPDCQFDSACQGRPAEICYGGEDEDGDGLTDCNDPNCFAYLPCQGGGSDKKGCGCRTMGANEAPGLGLLVVLFCLGLAVTFRRRARDR